MFQNKNRHHPRLYLAIAVTLTAGSLFFASMNAYRGAKASEERTLIVRTETMTLALDPREILLLAGDATDKKNPSYISIKHQFEKLREANKDVRFIYIAGRDNKQTSKNNIFFYLDSEPEGSSNYSDPGQSYPEASDEFHDVFVTGYSNFEGPLKDQWGTWVSAFVAIRHPVTGEVFAVLGVDIDAREYQKRIALVVAVPVLFISILFVVFFVGYKIYRREEELVALKTEFISIASHDIRSPLTGISWATREFLQDKRLAGLPDVLEMLMLMNKTMTDLLKTIDGIMDFSHLEHGEYSKLQFSDTDLSAIVLGSVEMMVLFAREKGVTLLLDDSWTESVPFVGDQEKIKRAIANIISNAIKYSPAGGGVHIGYQKKDVGQCMSHIISITDTGTGIPKEDQKKLFTKFFRAHVADTTVRPGTGLGLYFAKQFIELHGGTIFFESEKDKGTTFHITLPTESMKKKEGTKALA